jgi:uncharacterized protein YdeI (YjbR/CyaY-like superfamily)
MNIPKSLYFKDRKEWRDWLKKNYKKEKGVWLLHYKKHTKKPGALHKEALEEALCFGWIDSTLKRIDNEKFILKYTPRKENSIWSKLNKDTAERLTKEGKMAKAGFEKIEEAKKNGKWQAAYTSKKKLRIPPDLKKQLSKNKNALKNFKNFANTYQNMYIGWVTGAKTEETRKKRIKEVFKKAKENKKLYFM